jgi:asparagine synthase (glutamine-hydrolysing)
MGGRIFCARAQTPRNRSERSPNVHQFVSRFVCLFDRSTAAVDPDELRRLAEAMPGPLGRIELFCRGAIGIAVVHGPEKSDPQPSALHVDASTGTVVAVAGRFVSLETTRDATAKGWTATTRPAAWAATQGVADDPRRLAGVAGTFALVAADPRRPAVTVVRDHLGGHPVYYHLDARRMIAASEPAAILGHPEVPGELDEGSVARFLAFRFSSSESSFFRRIRVLPPAQALRVTASEARIERYWRFRRRGDTAGLPRDEIVAGFRSRVAEAVERATAAREPSRIAVALSGGLDSTALAALAPRGVRAFSWRFDETPASDERAAVAAVGAHLGQPIHWLRGDGLHALCEGFVERFVDSGSPHLNAFAALRAKLCESARAEGCTAVVVGDAGDALYGAQEYWLRDLLARGGPGALASLTSTVRRAWQGEAAARLALRRLVPVRGMRALVGGDRPPWLTAEGARLVPPPRLAPIVPRSPARYRYELAAGSKNVALLSEEVRFFARQGIERLDPFWSWPLLEWVLELPADWFYRDGRTKVLTREAFRGLLPESTLASPRVGTLGAFFLRGIEASRDDIRRSIFRRPVSDWKRFVDPAWVEPYLDATGAIQFGHTILWLVVSYELWCRHLAGRPWRGA